MLSDWSARLLICSFIHSFIHSFTHSLTGCVFNPSLVVDPVLSIGKVDRRVPALI